MLVSYKWLSEVLDLSEISPQELADQMSLTGIEVESVTRVSDGLKNLVVGFVEKCVPHPNSDHLSICQVDIGGDELSQIVCGASNIKAGVKVIVALPGARIAGGTKIKKGKIRGEISLGMICSLKEIGFSESVIPKESSEGIYYLPEKAIVGGDVYSYLDMDDSVIELAITPNRADALSMRGVSFEVGAILRQVPKFEEKILLENTNEKASDFISVQVESEEDTPSYHLRVIQEVRIAPSPLWLQKRLMIEGIRPINNVVDVTNYVLILFGQPLHAFDYEKFEGKDVVIRRAKEGEEITTLDEISRKLSPENLVITNNNKPVALAGVMGGKDTEIDQKTQTVVLEAAMFSPFLVRRTSKQMNLRSESSMRFEKGINTATIKEACDFAAAMIVELAGGTVVSGMITGMELISEKKIVGITLTHINDSLGTNLSVEEVNEIFEALGFEYKVTSTDYAVSIPSRRWDISIPADLLEEIARIYGYHRLPSTLPKSAVVGGLTSKQQLIRKLKSILSGAGLLEVISYALTTEEKSKQFLMKESNMTRLDWPMSEERSVLRLNIVSGLLDSVQYNVARQNNNIALYEFGRVFINKNDPLKDLPIEEECFAIVLSGSWQEADWKTEKQMVDFFHLKGILEKIFQVIAVDSKITYEATDVWEELHPGRAAKILLEDKVVGFLGQVHPKTSKAYDIPEAYVAEISIDTLMSLIAEDTFFTEISKFPESTRDIALLVDEKISSHTLIQTIQKSAGRFLKNVELFDVYIGDSIKKGKKSLGYTLTFGNLEDTLTDEEIQVAMNKIEKVLITEMGVQIR
ncbi:MAG: phenylalanine--tRNA ligase subunit beta [Lactobacillales bacterium]|jgi:phenylalanyl-tRNA synthetase beta chain|nr:phenylalanine--tRNA ligase subunit beta [Lactobacillales bacterium]